MSIKNIGLVVEQATPKQANPRKTATAKIKSARSRNRAEAWAWNVEQWRSYQHTMHPHDTDTVNQAADAMLAEGPDFARIHTGSVDERSHKTKRHKMDRNDRARLLHCFDAIAGGYYRHCRKPRGQGISPRVKQVLAYLLWLAVQKGEVTPALSQLADKLHMCKNTVLAALDWLRLFGFVNIQRRFTSWFCPLRQHERHRQTTNAYALNDKPSGLGGIATALFAPPQFNNSTALESPYTSKGNPHGDNIGHDDESAKEALTLDLFGGAIAPKEA